MKTPTFSILLGGILSLLLACQPTQSPTEVNETIYVRHQGADMPAYVHGNSEKKTFIVVLHGAGSFGLAFRDGAFTERLEEEYVVVYFDQRGQSMAQGHYDQPDDLIDLMASDVEALTQVLQHTYGRDIKLFLMGHSWGGLLSASALLRGNYQYVFNGWINLDGLMDLPSASRHRRDLLISIADEQMNMGNSIAGWQEIKEKVEALDPTSDDDYGEILRCAGQSMKLLLSDGIVASTWSSEKLYRTLIDNNPITWQVSHLFNQPVAYAREVDYSVLQELTNIDIPSLFIYGKYDVSVPPAAGEAAFLQLGATDKSYLRFDQSAHHPHDTESNRFADEVIRFINLHD